MFYEIYSSEYQLESHKVSERLKLMSSFYNEFKLIENKDKLYIASNVIKNLKMCNQLIKSKGEYAVYTPEELISIHNFSLVYYTSARRVLEVIYMCLAAWMVSSHFDALPLVKSGRVFL
jgi:hypothetical protein